MNNFKFFITLFVLLLFFVEFISFLVFKFNILEISHTPKLYLSKNLIPNDEWWTEEKEWGAWHKINSATTQRKSCFNVVYKSNEIGARDDSFKINNDNDIILIGDSFAEGYGVNAENTSQNFIEKITKRNVLNFGISKSFGPVQYFILYEKLAKKYKHKTLIIYLLPSNDFGENDYANWRGSKRYRPYYKMISENNYDTFIPDDSIKNYLSFGKKIKKKIKDSLWVSNIFININYKYRIYRSSKKRSNRDYSAYYDTPIHQQKAVIYFLNKIIESTSANVVLVSIPRPQDFSRFNNGSNLNKIYWNNYFTKKDLLNDNFKFVDLIKFAPENNNEIFLKCDGHWSPDGNLWAAKTISQFINKN